MSFITYKQPDLLLKRKPITFANEEFYKLASDKDYDCDIAARNS